MGVTFGRGMKKSFWEPRHIHGNFYGGESGGGGVISEKHSGGVLVCKLNDKRHSRRWHTRFSVIALDHRMVYLVYLLFGVIAGQPVAA